MRKLQIILLATLLLVGAGSLSAQSTDPAVNPSPGKNSKDDDRPQSIQETLVKMRIDQDKKEFDQMISRGGEVLKMTEEIEKAYETNGELTPTDYKKIENVEKLVKKIRSELGGGDDSEDKDSQPSKLATAAEAVTSLRQATVNMLDELKKTTRFTISTSAIQTTNAILRIARILRIKN